MLSMLRKTILIAMSLCLAACGGKIPEWLQSDDLVLPPAELVDFEEQFEIDVIWDRDTGKGAGDQYTQLTPWLQNQAIVTTDKEGEINSFDAVTGDLNWQIELEVPVATGVGGGEELILVGTQQGEVIALDEMTGRFKWRTRLSSEVLSPPKAGYGVVVGRTADGRITGLSAEDGTILWNYQRAIPLLSLRGDSPAVIDDDKVIAGYANGKLVALSITDGKVIWERSVSVSRGRTEIDRLIDIDSAPVVKLGTIYVVAFHGNLTAVDVNTGRQLWSREMSSRTGLDVDATEAVYVSDDQSYIWSIQDGTGDGLWRQTELLRRRVTAPTIAGDYIVVGDYDGYLHWLSRQDGSFVARERIASDAIVSQPIVQDDTLYVMSIDGELSAIRIPQ